MWSKALGVPGGVVAFVVIVTRVVAMVGRKQKNIVSRQAASLFLAIKRFAQALDADHLVFLRIVHWKNRISFKPERTPSPLGASSFLNSSESLFDFNVEASVDVALFACGIEPFRGCEFTTAVTRSDWPHFILLPANLSEAVKPVLDQAAVAL